MSDRLAAVRDYLTKKPDDRFALYSLGMELRKRGEWAECFATFERIIELFPTYGAGYYAYGAARRESGDADGARAAWNRGLVALGASDPHTRSELTSALQALDEDGEE